MCCDINITVFEKQHTVVFVTIIKISSIVIVTTDNDMLQLYMTNNAETHLTATYTGKS